MAHYLAPQKSDWSGRSSDKALYLHEKIRCLALKELPKAEKQYVLLGYACDEGVRRNQGRIGAKQGPSAIRSALGRMPDHLKHGEILVDAGTIACDDGTMEGAQKLLAEHVAHILALGGFPIVLGGGHDLAYGHYNGIKAHLNSKGGKTSIGIINFDAHFDLRDNAGGSNSGTPFFQLANENDPFWYLCLGVGKDANDRRLFETADGMKVSYLLRDDFQIRFWNRIAVLLQDFMKNVDHIYVTIDLDGFSSAYAPGASAASPMGFSPDIVVECLNTIMASGKLIGVDIAEMNPNYDVDGQTAKLAAALVQHILQ